VIIGGRPTPYVASLRVYEPADAFSKRFLDNLVSYPATLEGFAKEELHNLRKSVTSEKDDDGLNRAFLITNNGVNFYCPWNTSLRVRESLALIYDSYSLPMRKLFSLPVIDDVIETGRDSNSLSKTYLLTETWLIPPRWFSLFTKGDRLFGIRHEKKFVIYRTSLESALMKGNRALAIIRKSFGAGPLTEEVEELMNWISSFDSKSLLELDYGGLADLLDRSLLASGDSGIEGENSARDVWESLEALEVGDGLRAGSAYERLMSRWRGVSALEHAN